MFQLKAIRQEEFISLSLFILFRSPIHWMRPTHTRGKICFTLSTDSNVNITQKHPHRHTQNNVWANVWAPGGPVQLANQINHRNIPLLITFNQIKLSFSACIKALKNIAICYKFNLFFVGYDSVALSKHTWLWALGIVILRFGSYTFKRKRKAALDSRELAWYCLLALLLRARLGIFLLNGNNFTE